VENFTSDRPIFAEDYPGFSQVADSGAAHRFDHMDGSKIYLSRLITLMTLNTACAIGVR